VDIQKYSTVRCIPSSVQSGWMHVLTEWSLAGRSLVIQALKATFNVLCGVRFNQRILGRSVGANVHTRRSSHNVNRRPNSSLLATRASWNYARVTSCWCLAVYPERDGTAPCTNRL